MKLDAGIVKEYLSVMFTITAFVLIAQQAAQGWAVAATPYLQVFKDLIVALCALIGVCIACRGLNTWKRQLSGNVRHELARRWILSAYKLRNAIENTRIPGMSVGEIQSALHESGLSLEGLDQKSAYTARVSAVYFVRWNKVQEARSEFLVNSLEAEVHWGAAAKAAHEELKKTVHKLWAAIEIDRLVKSGQMELGNAEALDRMKIMSARDGKDEYMVELNAAVGKVEKIGKPHLIDDPSSERRGQ